MQNKFYNVLNIFILINFTPKILTVLAYLEGKKRQVGLTLDAPHLYITNHFHGYFSPFP